MTDALFHVEPVPLPEPPPKMTPDQRRALRQLEALRAGTHPLGMLPRVLPGYLPLHPDAAPADDRTAPGLRCGTCRFRLVLGYHNRSYAKCTFGQTEGRLSPRISHGAATDVRAWWPACRDYQRAEDQVPRLNRTGGGR
ncbi:MAG: hypothetical protein ACRDP6_14870 [Actinoallomurus sp.]